MADLWPSGHLMPSILMKYRTINTEEKEMRLQIAEEKNASAALTAEIRNNVFESKQWEVQFDQYGREFYSHMKTGEARTEQPAIMSYVPPMGRDDSGNITEAVESKVSDWEMLSDYKGTVSYRNKVTSEVTLHPPNVYDRIPIGKSSREMAREAAKTVLSFIKSKISSHIIFLKEKKYLFENPVKADENGTDSESDKGDENDQENENESQNKSNNDELLDKNGNKIVLLDPLTVADLAMLADPKGEDFSIYQYDIETVEMLAEDDNTDSEEGAGVVTVDDPEMNRKGARAFLDGSEIRYKTVLSLSLFLF